MRPRRILRPFMCWSGSQRLFVLGASVMPAAAARCSAATAARCCAARTRLAAATARCSAPRVALPALVSWACLPWAWRRTVPAWPSATAHLIRTIRVAPKGSPCGRASAAVIASAAIIHKPVAAPAMAVAPPSPRSHAEKDSIVEISRPIKPHGRAGIRRVVVIAIRTNRLNADVEADLGMGCRLDEPGCPQGQQGGPEQCRN